MSKKRVVEYVSREGLLGVDRVVCGSGEERVLRSRVEREKRINVVRVYRRKMRIER